MVTACVTIVTRVRFATSRNNKVQIGQRSNTRQSNLWSVHITNVFVITIATESEQKPVHLMEQNSNPQKGYMTGRYF